MLFEKISEEELEMIDIYRETYAYSNKGSIVNYNLEDLSYVLREWENKKSEYLFDLLGKELIISKKIAYEDTKQSLINEMYNVINGYTNNKKPVVFHKAYFDLCFSYFSKDSSKNEKCKFLMELASCESLVNNKYNGKTFEIDLPNGKKMKIQNGCRPIKTLAKIAEAFDLPEFEDFRLAHSMVLNKKEVKGTLNLSIHPMDYMTMSDNNSNWHSCMSWDREECYRQGTVEMMNSNCVIVAYVSNDEKKFKINSNLSWNNKRWRQLFIVKEGVIFSIKPYPYAIEEITLEVMGWLKELAKTNLGWTYSSELNEYKPEKDKELIFKKDKQYYALEFETSLMYNDFGCADCHYYYINSEKTVKSTHYRLIIDDKVIKLFYNYSGASECMICGALNPVLENASCLTCDDCQKLLICSKCGEIIPYDDFTLEVNGEYYCENCYDEIVRECIECGDVLHKEDVNEITLIPYLSPIKQELLLNERPGKNNFINNEEFNYHPSELKISICPNCYESWIEENLIEGHRPHLRSHIWNGTGIYVYFDDLTEEGKKAFFISQVKTNEDLIKYLEKSAYYTFGRSEFIKEI